MQSFFLKVNFEFVLTLPLTQQNLELILSSKSGSNIDVPSEYFSYITKKAMTTDILRKEALRKPGKETEFVGKLAFLYNWHPERKRSL